MTESRAKRSLTENGVAKDEIIASIRRNLATSAPFDAVHREHHRDEQGAIALKNLAREDLSRDVLIDNLRQNLESVGAHCTVVAEERNAGKQVRKIIENTGARRIAITDSELVKRVVGDIETIENAPADVLFECDMGITSTQWAIAETGTLVLESEKERHRLASLVPRVHLCILKATQIRQTLGEILELTGKDLSRTITFITGASRTSDIELTLAIGVHGPAELHVIVLADQ